MPMLLQTPAANPTILPVLAIVLGCVIVVVPWLLYERHQRRKHHQRFVALMDERNFEPIRDTVELQRIADTIQKLFGEVAMNARRLTLRGAMRYPMPRFDVTVVQVVLGLEASNANGTTLHKVVVLLSGFDRSGEGGLPRFKLMPNNVLFRQIHRTPVFHASSPFGKRNLVLTGEASPEHEERVQHIINRDAREALMDNSNLVIESLGDTLAFYLHDEQVQPDDLDGFIQHAATLATIFEEQNREASPRRWASTSRASS